MQVSPPFTPAEGTIRTSPSHNSTHTFPSLGSAQTIHSSGSGSTIPEGPSLKASSSDEESLLARGLDVDKNWTWSERKKAKWELVTGGCQKFYDYWRDSSNKSKFRHEFPYPLSLEIDREGKSSFPLPLPKTSRTQILVTEAYEKMFHHLLLIRVGEGGIRTDEDGIRMDEDVSCKGAIITGQSGIGKTTFLGFLLVQLLSLGQVVLLCDSDEALLFYHGQVYSRSAKDAFRDLPTNREYFPVWTLIEADRMKDGPSISLNFDIWAIQASSLHPNRYKSWRKQTGAALLGMPLWSKRELKEGLPLAIGYRRFRSRLEYYLRTSEPPTDTNINAAVKVLIATEERERLAEEERERIAAEERERVAEENVKTLTVDLEEDTNGEEGQLLDVTTSTTGVEEGTIDKGIKKAFKILVRNAIEEVGYAPRDVYSCILSPDSTKADHASQVKGLTYEDLQRTVQSFTKDGGLPELSHLVVAVWPCQLGLHHANWSIGFKSNRIAKLVATTMRSAEVVHLQQTNDLLRQIPATSAMAGQLFEAFAHRMFSKRWEGSKSPPQPTLMTSNGAQPPTFSSDASSSPPPHPPRQPIRYSDRDTIYVDLPSNLSNVKLSSDRYYVPTAPNNPLFDSFTIDHDLDNHTVVLSIFQMTTSQKHGGSGKGYSYIQSVMTHIRTLLGDDPTTVKVTYFLVCPEGKSVNEWTMPLGWETKIMRKTSAGKNMHVGDVFCLRFPGFHYIEDNQSEV